MSESPRARAMIISGTAAVVCGILSGAILAIRAPGAAATTTAQPAAPEPAADEAGDAAGSVPEAPTNDDVAGGDAAPPETAAPVASAAPAASASASAPAPAPSTSAPPPRKAPAPKKSPVLGF